MVENASKALQNERPDRGTSGGSDAGFSVGADHELPDHGSDRTADEGEQDERPHLLEGIRTVGERRDAE